jgi:hypothetical protein
MRLSTIIQHIFNCNNLTLGPIRTFKIANNNFSKICNSPSVWSVPFLLLLYVYTDNTQYCG